jgi:hypothetical protein
VCCTSWLSHYVLGSGKGEGAEEEEEVDEETLRQLEENEKKLHKEKCKRAQEYLKFWGHTEEDWPTAEYELVQLLEWLNPRGARKLFQMSDVKVLSVCYMFSCVVHVGYVHLMLCLCVC